MTSPIASKLAELPGAELRQMLTQAEGERTRLQIEMEQLDFETRLLRLALAGRSKPQSQQQNDSSRPASTRQRVMDVLSGASEPLTPKQIMAAMGADAPKRESVYNTLSRMTAEEKLERVEGAYKLAGRDAAPSGVVSNPDQNGGGGPLFMAPHVPSAAS